mgnify:CR=1 FL=1
MAKTRVEVIVALEYDGCAPLGTRLATEAGIRGEVKQALDSGRGDVRLKKAKWIDDEESNDG